MKVYVAASETKRAKEAALLVSAVFGHEVVSRWHDAEKKVRFREVERWRELVAVNFAAIRSADLLLCLPCNRHDRPGILIEVGYALRGETPVVVFADRLRSSLLHHPLVSRVSTPDELETRLKELAAALPPPAVAPPIPRKKRTTWTAA